MRSCETLLGWIQDIKSAIASHRRDAATRRELRQELAGLSRHDFDRVLADIGLSRDEMETVIQNAPRSRKLLDSMVRRLDLQRGLSLAAPRIVRDLERRCATCGNQKDCGEWFAAEAPGDGYRNFCPNASAFDALLRKEAA